ncbi:hypothetical protein H696_01478 [Fonticula alba]|uniref:Uncharacterized protein n=1 Tax=Fonticula alba TaxID=691883 RepID=A0A058ZCD3_FONAL|nr:hypothetical protein H696_01478 [Fonticula alba]KCV72070.1 hypothetical protein H696_01478 [Fonticula alba]|eukprot:XP_009493648.1 hypothetical protein H696_01478 [Fonticula alba]
MKSEKKSSQTSTFQGKGRTSTYHDESSESHSTGPAIVIPPFDVANAPRSPRTLSKKVLNSPTERIIIHREGAVAQDMDFGEVKVRKIEVNRSEESALNAKRIAEARAKILEAQRVRRDESILAAEARKMAETSLENAEQACKVVEVQEKLKMSLIEKEREFERQRVEAHEAAVEAENCRANARAEEVLFIEQRKEALSLAAKHELAAEHALKIEKAYGIVLAEAERRQAILVSDVQYEVIGELNQEVGESARIRVEIEPLGIQESRMQSSAKVRATAKLAEVTEHLPQHPPIVVHPEAVEARRVHTETHVITTTKSELLASLNNETIEAVARPIAHGEAFAQQHTNLHKHL